MTQVGEHIKLSVVIRCRNEAKSLRQVFEALKAQQCGFAWEIVVVDNESEDNTPAVCREYGARVVTLPRSEFTYGRATNVGIEHARGELILLISAHALPIGSHFFESAVAPFRDPEMAAARCLWLGSTKDVLGQWHKPNDIQYKSHAEQQAAESGTKWLSQYPTAGCCVLRRSVWEQVKYDETLEANEDKYWASQVLARGYKMRSCAEAMWVYMRNYSPRDRWRKDNREQLAFYRMTGRPPMSWPRFFVESARALLTAPSIAFRHAVGKLIWNTHLVTIPWQARRAAKAGSLPEFERRPAPVSRATLQSSRP
ncbi:MAG TPA: glycosyltransferase family 2 protein [Verrucomicrobiae bacterium]|nr:glycosyltransferase family 2 protein [Verrucomicrobiae bacterium]